ncbi:unnamed protein product [Rhizoctonia solani]|uniref:Uncharacterized protein n=1 Tax=Rhizoctonia solani TaxID=456999 RepID=A0A8H3E715_9AGAM|nr:unnamed protein product [Rhizoctonia solani]
MTRALVVDLALGEDPVQTDLLDTNVTQSPPSSPKPPNKSNRRESTRNKTKGKGKEPRRAQATESESGDEFSSDRGSDSSDYDRKDKSDEGSSSEDDYQLDLDEGTHGLGAGGGGVKSIRRLLPKDFNPRECPWGGFPDPKVCVDLPDYIAPETLLPPMRSAYDELDAALQEWHQNTLKAENLQAERSYGTSEQNNPVLSDPRSGPMYATILTRELVWNVRKAQGETLYPILERLKTASSTAAQYSLAWVEFMKSTESLGDKGPDLGELNNLGKRLRMKTIEACWIYDEMLDYAHLATAMHKMMDWSPDPQQRPAPDSPDIRKHAVWCKDWAEATEELEGEMMAHRREYWRKTGRPFEKQFSKPSPYKFGNAVKEEWHQAFEACLALSEAPVPPSTPTPVAPSPTVNPEATDESATTQPEEEPTVDKMAQPEEGPAVNEMEQDPQDNAMANETEPDMPTEPTTSASGPDASHSTAGKATTSTSSKRGRKSGPGKQVPPPAGAQKATGVIQRETRANAKRKAEEAQQATRKSLRRK